MNGLLRSLFGSDAKPVELLPHDMYAQNTMPGWSVTWLPPDTKTDPDCKSFPFYAHRGLGEGASYGQSDFAIAPTAAHVMAHSKM